MIKIDNEEPTLHFMDFARPMETLIEMYDLVIEELRILESNLEYKYPGS